MPKDKLIIIEDTSLSKAMESKDEFALVSFSAGLNMAKVTEYPSLANLKKNTEPSKIMTLMYKVLEKKMKSLGDRGNLSPEEIKAFVLDFYSERETESIEDLVLMMDWGRQGKLGKVYAKVDVIMLNEWAKCYFDMKYTEIERQQQNQKQKHKFEMSSEVAEKLREDIKKIGRKDGI